MGNPREEKECHICTGLHESQRKKTKQNNIEHHYKLSKTIHHNIKLSKKDFYARIVLCTKPKTCRERQNRKQKHQMLFIPNPDKTKHNFKPSKEHPTKMESYQTMSVRVEPTEAPKPYHDLLIQIPKLTGGEGGGDQDWPLSMTNFQ